jgi:hypothetical protein
MMPFPSREELEKVIEERQAGTARYKTGYVDLENFPLYIDEKGLIHKGGPKGNIVSYIGWRKSQLEKAGDNEIMPMPR